MRPGDVLYFHAEEEHLVVVAVSDQWVRFYSLDNPVLNDDGSLQTTLTDLEAIDESCSFQYNIEVMSSEVPM